jgi:hypothetical protein
VRADRDAKEIGIHGKNLNLRPRPAPTAEPKTETELRKSRKKARLRVSQTTAREYESGVIPPESFFSNSEYSWGVWGIPSPVAMTGPRSPAAKTSERVPSVSEQPAPAKPETIYGS